MDGFGGTFGASRAALALVVVGSVAGLAACSNTSNNARPGGPTDAGRDAADPRGTPYLWYAGGAVNAFSRSQSLASHDEGPAFTVVPEGTGRNCHDLAFDGAGNLWTIPVGEPRVLRLPAARLTQPAPVLPDLVVTSAALAGPQSLIFDAAGNLWVLSYSGTAPSVASVVRFDDPRALAGSQALTPSITVGPGPDVEDVARFRQATAIAFDAAGNLWLSATANLLRFDASTLVPGAHPAPATILTTGEATASLAFDADGALWVTSAKDGAFSVLRFAGPGSLRGTVSPAPAARVKLPLGPATFAGGLGFDLEGGLWIAASDRLVKLSHAASLSGAVDGAPAVVLGQAEYPDLASKIVVRPTPPGLPIFSP